MKTLQLSSFGAPTDVVELVELDPADPGPGQLAVSIEAAPINPSNLWLERTPRATVAQTYRELAALVADGTLAASVEATYALADYREAVAHAARNDRNGKVLFALR